MDQAQITLPSVSSARSRPTARRTGVPWRWLAGAACGAVLAIPAAVPGPAATAAASVITAAARQAASPADQFRGVSCPADRFCLGVGWYIPSDGVKRPLAERWDGSSWQVLFPVVPRGASASVLEAVSCVSPARCLAVGDTNASGDHGPVFGELFAETWDGSTWQLIPVAGPGRAVLSDVSCGSARSCVAVGYRTTNAGADRAISGHWNGTQWSFVRPRRPQPVSQLLGVSCPGPRNCWASGWTGTSLLDSQRALIEHWDGTRWSTRPLPGAGHPAQLRSVSCPTGIRCTAVGASGDNTTRMLVEDLSRGNWTATVLSRTAVNPGSLGLDHVSCLARRACSAVTRYISVATDELTWAIVSRGRTGGFRLQVLPANAAMDDPRDLSCSAHGCTLVGGKGDSDGRGDQFDIGSTLAWRGTGTGFAPQVTPLPPVTAPAG